MGSIFGLTQFSFGETEFGIRAKNRTMEIKKVTKSDYKFSFFRVLSLFSIIQKSTFFQLSK
jgi:hypothetical protein